MESLSEKLFLQLDMPTDDDSLSDADRIRQALTQMGYRNVTIPLPVLQQLYPLCRDAGFRITISMVHREYDWVLTRVEAGDQRNVHYGLAVDYGSTTILMQLVDLTSGAVMAEEKTVNGQTVFGTDILTRITYVMEDPARAEALHRATTETFLCLMARLEQATGVDVKNCPVMVISGNTTMIHFLLKLNAWTVFASPFAPVCADPGFLWGSQLDMDFSGLVYIIPAASNYVGGDIVSGLLALELHKQEEVSLFFDIGTNGELVIGNREWILAGAGAAGPALEGYISRYGMRAAPGAIDHVSIRQNQLQYTTIDGRKPVGICGSGIIDLLAQMRLAGWIDISGQLQPQASSNIHWIDDGAQYAAVYAFPEESGNGEMLYFSQTDIMQYLDTKAAAYTMVECLLETAGVTAEELARIYLSGAFPAHSDLESAITIGMFPDVPRQRYQCLRNSSLDGARILLLDRHRLTEVKQLREKMYCVQFASVPDFLVRMQAAKFVPHTDMDRYPTVRRRLQETEENR